MNCGTLSIQELSVKHLTNIFMVWCQFHIMENLSEFKPRYEGDDNIIGVGDFIGGKITNRKPEIGDYYYKDNKTKRYTVINVVFDYELSRAEGINCYHIQLLRDWNYRK